MPTLFISPRARDDIKSIRHYLADDDPDVARRFNEDVQQTMETLAASPGMGALYPHPTQPTLRCFPIRPKFRKYLVFYIPVVNGIRVFRVLHGARDLPAVLDE